MSEEGASPRSLHVSQITEEFDTFGISLSHEALNQCLFLCEQYGIDSEQLAVLWLTFSNTHGYDSVTVEALEHLKRQEQESQRKKATAAAASVAANKLNESVDNGCLSEPVDDDEDLLEAYSGNGSVTKTPKRTLTPKGKRSTDKLLSISAQFHSANLSPSVINPSQKYSSRTNAGTVVVHYGADDVTWTADPYFQPKVKLLGSYEDELPLTKAYKFMYEKPSLVGEVLNDMALDLAKEMKDIMLKKEKKGEEEEEEDYCDVTALTSNTISTVGRICCDCSSHLNAASVLLEGCIDVNNQSKSAELDLSQVNGFSIFPGQIVGVKGTNPSGHKLLAQELMDGKLPQESSSPITITTTSGPVQVVVASGPFTTTSNLIYEPLTDFLTTLCKNPPHILVLLGPFLDAGHPLVVGNDLGESHEAVFSRCLRIIASTLESTMTKVILVSSSRDVCSPMVYPTPPYDDVAAYFTCVSDPAFLEIEGVVVALTATDVLFHLGKEEISAFQGADRMKRLTCHMLKQRSLYPLYPPHESMCVVMEQLESYAHLPCKPHLLVIPSDLRYFVKEVEGCVAVNPEHLAKGLIGGTYARIELHPPSKDKGMAGSINVNVLRV